MRHDMLFMYYIVKMEFSMQGAFHIVAFVILTCEASQRVNSTDFWNKAEKTLDLQILRQDLINSNMITVDPPKAYIQDTILDSPHFLPLCGNGRIDTQTDYAVYYRNKSHSLLQLTKQQILYQYTTFQTQRNCTTSQF